MCCASSPRLSTPLDSASPHRSAFHIEKKNHTHTRTHTTACLFSASSSCMFATECDSSAMVSHVAASNRFWALMQGETNKKICFKNERAWQGAQRALSRSLPSPPSATYWNCPPGILRSCPDRAIAQTKGFSCLFSLVVWRQVATVIALCNPLKASFKEDKPLKDVQKPLK